MDLKEEIKNRLNIVNIIGRYVDLKKAGTNYKANCPFHSESTPSFMVSEEMQIFKCFGCNKSGDIFTFLMEMEGIEFKDALNQLGEEAGVDLSKYSFKQNNNKNSIYYEMNETALKFFSYTLLKLPAGKKALNYLKNRGLGEKHIKEFQLGYAPNSWNSLLNYLTKKNYTLEQLNLAGLIKKGSNNYYDVYRGRIIFPLINQGGKIVGFSGRTIINEDPKYINTKDTPIFKKSDYIYNLDKAKTEIRRKKEVMVTEGEFDAITPFIKGIKNIVALKGTAFTTNQAKLLKRYADTAYIFFDSDLAGNLAAVRGIQIAQNLGLDVKVARLPQKYKDPDEAAKQSIDIIYKAIEDSIGAFDYYFEYILKTNDSKEPLDKKKIATFLNPKISSISDPILKSHYIKKLSELLEVEESIIQLEVQETKQNLENIKDTKETIQKKPENGKDALVYLINSDKPIFNKYYKIAKKENLLTEFEKDILEKYKKEVLKDKVSSGVFKKKEGLEDLFLKNTLEKEETSERQEKEIQKILIRRFRETNDKIKKQLSISIKKAEKSHNNSQIKELSKEFNNIMKKEIKF